MVIWVSNQVLFEFFWLKKDRCTIAKQISSSYTENITTFK